MITDKEEFWSWIDRVNSAGTLTTLQRISDEFHKKHSPGPYSMEFADSVVYRQKQLETN
jgi:hypothetical protein